MNVNSVRTYLQIKSAGASLLKVVQGAFNVLRPEDLRRTPRFFSAWKPIKIFSLVGFMFSMPYTTGFSNNQFSLPGTTMFTFLLSAFIFSAYLNKCPGGPLVYR